MIDYDFGDVVLVPFPFTDQSTSKKRPAVVVSSNRFHQARADVILMAISSQTETSNIVGGTMIQAWEEGGLLKPSIIKPVLTTLQRDLLLKKLGRLENSDQTALREYLHLILG